MKNKAKYYIYRNLNRGGFSVRFRGKVIDRVDDALIYDPTFRVSMKGWARCVLEKVRNVHAFIVCNEYKTINTLKVKDINNVNGKSYIEVKYNPFRMPAFTLKDTETPIHSLPLVCLSENRCFSVQP